MNDCLFLFFFFFMQNTAYDMRISDWSSDVCSSDLADPAEPGAMIAALAPDQPPPRPLPLRALNSERDFQRRINRFGTTVRKEYPVEPVGHQGGEALRQLERQRMTELKGRREVERRGGLRDRFADFGTAVPGVAAPEARRAIEDRPPVGALVEHAAGGHDLARVRLERTVRGKGHPEGRQLVVVTPHREPLLPTRHCERSEAIQHGLRGLWIAQRLRRSQCRSKFAVAITAGNSKPGRPLALAHTSP